MHNTTLSFPQLPPASLPHPTPQVVEQSMIKLHLTSPVKHVFTSDGKQVGGRRDGWVSLGAGRVLRVNGSQDRFEYTSMVLILPS